MKQVGRAPRWERSVAVLFGLGIAGALATAVVYAYGGQTQLEGVGFAIAFGGLGAGLVVWAHHLHDDQHADTNADTNDDTNDEPGSDGEVAGEVIEAWEFAPDQRCDEAAGVAEIHAEIDRGEILHRRSMLRRMLLGALGALGVAAVFPVRSLGPSPGNSLRVTPWRRGRRLVDADGRPIPAAGIPAGGLVTAFPDGATEAADAVVVVVRVGPAQATSTGASASASPPVTPDRPGLEGLYVYSKICTHAGCPVGLYVDTRRTLLCPCHQSEFDVVDGATPTSGPADRPLPRLPVSTDRDGLLVAEGDFDEPTGPAWWSL